MAKKSTVKADQSNDKLLKQILAELKSSKAEISKLAKANEKTERQVHRLKKRLENVKFCSCAKGKKSKSKKKKSVSGDDIGSVTATPLLEKVLSEPIDGKPDDLKWIAGVGPKLEETLNGLGVFHFDQIAKWTKSEIDWVDDYLKFSGRIERDNWIDQAKALAKGGWDEYVKVFGKEPR